MLGVGGDLNLMSLSPLMISSPNLLSAMCNSGSIDFSFVDGWKIRHKIVIV
jgi:hypothetical protein